MTWIINKSIHLPNFTSTSVIWHKFNFFVASTAGLNSEFSFYLSGYQIRDKEFSLPYYLPIAGNEKKIDVCFVQSENSSRI